MRRILFHEITKNAVRKAIDQPLDIDMNKVNAQQARRVLDRLVGYKISPLLWDKVRRGLSAGRVQSVAVRLTADERRLWRLIADGASTVDIATTAGTVLARHRREPDGAGVSSERLRNGAVERFLKRHRTTVVLGEYLDQFLDFVGDPTLIAHVLHAVLAALRHRDDLQNGVLDQEVRAQAERVFQSLSALLEDAGIRALRGLDDRRRHACRCAARS